MADRSNDIIRASEIAEYVYCARAWWLHQIRGFPSRNRAALHQGQEAHDRHGRTVAAAQWQRRVALLAAAAGLLAALAALIFLLAGPGA